MPSPRVIAVIPTINRKKLLLECIEALLRQTVPLSRIILVDNAGTDGAMDAVRSRYPGDPLFEIHSLDRNTGAAMGFHYGVERALEGECDWVWFTDDDSEPRPDALEKLLSASATLAAEGKKAAGLACLKRGLSGAVQTLHNSRFTWRQVAVPERDCRGIVPIGHAAFTGLLVSREAIESAGNVDPVYLDWGADLEFCLRLSSAGGLFLVADSEILHKDDASDPGRIFRLEAFWRYYIGMRNWVHIARKHRGNWTVPLVFAAIAYRILTIWTGMDRKTLRTRLMLRAMADGFRGDFSDPVDAVRWREIIGGAPIRKAPPTGN
jgi:GT2 family glycosyltransferase